MAATAVFIRHQALPGQRDEVRRVWEKHVKPRATANAAHAAYSYCYDTTDSDTIWVYQQYRDRASSEEFTKAPWYNDYVQEVSRYVVGPPQVSVTTLVWSKEAIQ